MDLKEIMNYKTYVVLGSTDNEEKYAYKIKKSLLENDELRVIELSDETLDKIYSFFKEDENEAIVRIDANDVQDIVNSLEKFAKSKKITHPVLVVPMDIRHMVFVILAEFVQNITVLAQEELASNYNIKFIGKI